MNSKEAEETQDEDDNFKTIIVNILKEVRESFASMKQEQEAVKRNSQKMRKYSG